MRSTGSPQARASMACLAGLLGFAFVGSGRVEAQFGQASPHTLELNCVFYSFPILNQKRD